MPRMDEGMPFLLKYENVAWYENGKVRILDRRCYPTEVNFVECTSYKEVGQAVKDMVTQSAGPYTAIGMGMALAAYECRGKSEKEQTEFLEKACYDLGHCRPTTANRYMKVTEGCLAACKKALSEGKDPIQAAFDETIESLERRYAQMQVVGDNLLPLIPEGGTILTQCYGETIIGTLIKAAHRENKEFKVFCAETRPFFQGARLTASCFASSGFDTTVISDNMVAYSMQHQGISLFTSAADSIARDGHIANKVGSFQIAILAKYFGIPYYVTGRPDDDKMTGNDIVIELRDPSQVLEYRGIKNTLPEVKAIYPAFDVVPPHLISGIVTDKGLFVPHAVNDYYKGDVKAFY